MYSLFIDTHDKNIIEVLYKNGKVLDKNLRLSERNHSDYTMPMLDEILKVYKEIIDLEGKIENLVIKMQSDSSEELGKEYSKLHDRYELLDGYTYKKEYETAINKFGFSDEDKNKKISEFSGGQRTKIAFIKLLLSKPDLLLLDEPTNHLDITTIEWLEGYLKNYPKAVVIVSHDRMFLNKIVDKIYEIEYGAITEYSGDYEFFEKQKRVNYERQLKDFEFQQKEIKRLKSIYERFRYKPSKASMALSKLKQIEHMDLIDKPLETDMRVFKTNLSEMEESVKKVLIADNLVIGYDKPLANIDLTIMRGKKIGVIGENGIGKSTLLKTLNGLIDPISGHVSYGLHVTPGYFDQNLAMIDKDNTVLQEFRSHLPNLTEPICRRALGSFLFKGDDVLKKINVLSGGEKVRLELCKILFDKPNFLLLDEPTNHMDISSKEHLEDILSEYQGTIIFVSHDRYFVKKIADQLLVFEKNGVTFYPYGYDEYTISTKEKLKTTLVEKSAQKVKEEPENRKKVNTYELKKELNRLENEIIKCETKIKVLESDLFNTDVYTDYNKSNAINEKIKLLQIDLEKLNSKWEDLTNILIEN